MVITNKIDLEIKLIYELILNAKRENTGTKKINKVEIFQKDIDFIIRHKFMIQKFSGYAVNYEYYSFYFTNDDIKQR